MTATEPNTKAARQAWRMAFRKADPMPPDVTLDWLREQTGTDDVAALKAALYDAAVTCLTGRLHHDYGFSQLDAPRVLGRMGEHDFGGARIEWRYLHTAFNLRTARLGGGWYTSKRIAWLDACRAALDLCERIAAL